MKTFYEIEFTDGSHFPRRPKTLTAAKAYVSYGLRYEGWKHEDIARINFVVEHIGGVARFVVCEMNAKLCKWEKVQ